MEIESESLHPLSHLSIAELYDHIINGLNEIENRFRVTNSKEIKHAIQTALFTLNSKIFTILNIVAFKGRSADDYTPFRANVEHSKLQQPNTYICSFDYSENILVPHLIETPGIFFFKTRRKIDLFGITNESTDRQLNFLIDEPFKISKGPNSVISMLDYYIKRNIPEGVKLIFYADNCAAQNKNSTMIAYLCYLAKIIKRHPQIELYFMISGHTKFTPDRHFGTIKSKIRTENCFSIQNLIGEQGLIKKSAYNNDVIAYKDPITRMVEFDWFDWKNYFNKKFIPCKGIQKWHAVKIHPGGEEILVANYIDQNYESVKVMKKDESLLESVSKIIPEGFDDARKNELKFFKDYVTSDHHAFVCGSY